MPRPAVRPLRLGPALAPGFRARGLHSGSAADEEPYPAPESRLQRRRGSRAAAWTATASAWAELAPGRRLGAAAADALCTLILHAPSTNLGASDFHRLASQNSLSDWRMAITSVQQQRDAFTLEPLARYQVSFATASAAACYRDRLVRLHRLARHKAACPDGLWESTVPAHLRSPTGQDPAAELDAFTLFLPSQHKVQMEAQPSSGPPPWLPRLAAAVGRLGYGEKPPMVLLHLDPPVFGAADLQHYIRRHGRERGCCWKVSPPQRLADLDEETLPAAAASGRPPPRSATSETSTPGHVRWDRRQKLQSRFLVACANEDEAQRFYRHWNHRYILDLEEESESEAPRAIVYASIIDW